jgi:uncharacterized membrane protein YhaH (DUF805 family)
MKIFSTNRVSNGRVCKTATKLIKLRYLHPCVMIVVRELHDADCAAKLNL